jgi:hypothetical protein
VLHDDDVLTASWDLADDLQGTDGVLDAWCCWNCWTRVGRELWTRSLVKGSCEWTMGREQRNCQCVGYGTHYQIV